MVSRLFYSPSFIARDQLKHKSSNQGQTNHLIESSYRLRTCFCYIKDHNGTLLLVVLEKQSSKHCTFL